MRLQINEYKKLCISLKKKNADFLNEISMKYGIPKSIIIQKILDKFEDENINIIEFYEDCNI